ncbi:MAG: HD domain-containing protein, partial [Planctomycetes bacterium]|nr:HD domain-containing protein [Planctomycetota bacterium]
MAAPDEVAPELLLPASRLPLDAMERELDGHLAAVADPDYAALLHEFFDDPEFRRAFVRAPAAKSNHHAWVGGLLEHTVTMARYARAFLDEANVTLDASLLMTGVILHDAGKVHELSLGAAIEYSDRGRLLGHITIGVGMVAERAARLPGFPPEKTWLLQHLILSHHGRQEYGSPVLPAVPEALVLHHLDNLDAKSVAAAGVLESDPTPGHWTARSFMLDTCLYRGDSRPTTGSAPAGADIAPAPATSAAPHGPS